MKFLIKNGKPNWRLFLRLAALIIFLASSLLMLRQFRDKETGAIAYENAVDMAISQSPEQEYTAPMVLEPLEEEEIYWTALPIEEDDPNLEYLEQINIQALQEVNPDVLGWIFIPKTVINYPILQGEDNDFYLKHTWEKKPNAVGSIFVECENNPTFQDFNTILYGHNMNDGSMFAEISRYPQQWFFDQHPYIYVVLPDHILRYEVFSAYRTELDARTYGLSFFQDETRENFLLHAMDKSTIVTEVFPDITDLILTLSTCVGNDSSTRYVAHARLKMLPTK